MENTKVPNKAQLCLILCNPLNCSLPGFKIPSVHGDSPAKNTAMGCHSLLQGIFPIQWSKPSPTLEADSLPSEPPRQPGKHNEHPKLFAAFKITHCIFSFPFLSLLSPLVMGQFSSVQSLSSVRLFATPWIAARQASLSITSSRSLLKLMSIQLVMPSSHLILCHPLLLLPPIPPSIRVFSNESTLCMRWPKCWSFSFNISPSNAHPGLISFRMNWLDLLAVQVMGTPFKITL